MFLHGSLILHTGTKLIRNEMADFTLHCVEADPRPDAVGGSR